MTTLRLSMSLLALTMIASCLGTETGNPPLINWRGSPCKSAPREKAVSLQSLDTGDAYENPLYDGLNCIVWQRLDETTLRIDVTNYEDACGSDASWTADAKLDDNGTLQLQLQDTKCERGSCDYACTFDLSYTVRVDDSSRDLPVRLSHEGCDYEPNERVATLPLSTAGSGAVCRYAYGGSHKGIGNGTFRRTCEGLGPPEACAATLVCADDRVVGKVCLPSCQSDADCDALTHCSDGVCKLRATGLELVNHNK